MALRACISSSSRMPVMNHNWSARKQRLHLQSATGISRHSALSEDRIRQCGTSIYLTFFDLPHPATAATATTTATA